MAERQALNASEKVCIFLVIVLGSTVGALFFDWLPTPTLKINVSYQEFVTTVLALVTILLAILGIVVGVLAFWGYKNIKDEAVNAAARAATKIAINRSKKDEDRNILSAYARDIGVTTLDTEKFENSGEDEFEDE